MAESHDATGGGMDLFLQWAARTGELNDNTVTALRGACRSVLAADEAGDTVDVTSVDVETLLDRWENLNRTRYSSGSLMTYRSRFRQSVAMYKAWLVKDPAWKAAGKPSSSKGTKGAATVGRQRKPASVRTALDALPHTDETSAARATTGPAAVRLVAYEMPLRPDLLVRLTLPVDLTAGDAARLSAFVRSLAFASEPTHDEPAGTLPPTSAADASHEQV